MFFRRGSLRKNKHLLFFFQFVKGNLIMILDNCPVIAAIHSSSALETALCQELPVLFLLNANLLTLPEVIAKCKLQNRTVFVHIDLCEGLSKDRSAIAYLARLGADGIISTRSNVIRWANECGMQSVQRFFLLDSQSIQNAFDAIASCSPTMIELMPGILPKLITRFTQKTDLPVIAGGLIETKEEIFSALNAGAVSISTTNQLLWTL